MTVGREEVQATSHQSAFTRGSACDSLCRHVLIRAPSSVFVFITMLYRSNGRRPHCPRPNHPIKELLRNAF